MKSWEIVDTTGMTKAQSRHARLLAWAGAHNTQRKEDLERWMIEYEVQLIEDEREFKRSRKGETNGKKDR